MTHAPELPSDPRNAGPRDEKGRFGKGYMGGRKHRIDLLSVCDRAAREEGHNLEDLLWSVVKGLIVAASSGNTKAARLLFDKFVRNDGQGETPATDTPGLQVNFNVSTTGPQPPTANGALADYLEEFGRLSGELRRTPKLTVSSAHQDIVDELLS